MWIWLQSDKISLPPGEKTECPQPDSLGARAGDNTGNTHYPHPCFRSGLPTAPASEAPCRHTLLECLHSWCGCVLLFPPRAFPVHFPGATLVLCFLRGGQSDLQRLPAFHLPPPTRSLRYRSPLSHVHIPPFPWVFLLLWSSWGFDPQQNLVNLSICLPWLSLERKLVAAPPDRIFQPRKA